MRRYRLLASVKHPYVGLQTLLRRLLHLSVGGFRVRMALEEGHYLIRRNLLPERLFHATAREHSV